MVMLWNTIHYNCNSSWSTKLTLHDFHSWGQNIPKLFIIGLNWQCMDQKDKMTCFMFCHWLEIMSCQCQALMPGWLQLILCCVGFLLGSLLPCPVWLLSSWCDAHVWFKCLALFSNPLVIINYESGSNV